MECLTCHTRMECYNDVNDVDIKIDFLKCPKCNSKATVYYNRARKYKEKVIWDR
jgi:uncharacterized protein (UPF0212 family)